MKTPGITALVLLALMTTATTASARWEWETPWISWDGVDVRDLEEFESESIDPVEISPPGSPVSCPGTTTVEQIVCNTLAFVEPVRQFANQQVVVVVNEANANVAFVVTTTNTGIVTVNAVVNTGEGVANNAAAQAVILVNQALDQADVIVLIVLDGADRVVMLVGDFGDDVAAGVKEACTRNVPGGACNALPGQVSHLLP